mmetsp:Transcript_13805/g.48759  ORF Transcript_13805/g.48759 Transcript_13805/m.48759 type:complete len:242 (+) Transcript_13805:937-1662(+)
MTVVWKCTGWSPANHLKQYSGLLFSPYFGPWEYRTLTCDTCPRGASSGKRFRISSGQSPKSSLLGKQASGTRSAGSSARLGIAWAKSLRLACIGCREGTTAELLPADESLPPVTAAVFFVDVFDAAATAASDPGLQRALGRKPRSSVPRHKSALASSCPAAFCSSTKASGNLPSKMRPVCWCFSRRRWKHLWSVCESRNIKNWTSTLPSWPNLWALASHCSIKPGVQTSSAKTTASAAVNV